MIELFNPKDLDRRLCNREGMSYQDTITFFDEISQVAQNQNKSVFYFLDNGCQFLSDEKGILSLSSKNQEVLVNEFKKLF